MDKEKVWFIACMFLVFALCFGISFAVSTLFLGYQHDLQPSSINGSLRLTPFQLYDFSTLLNMSSY